MRKKIEYEQLPVQLTLVVRKTDFIKGYDCADREAFVVWFANRATGKQQEVEFSLREQRILSRAEREKDFPPEEEIALPGLGFRVIKGYYLEQGTDVRYETYDVYPEGIQSKLLTCEQIYFSPVLINIGELVRSAAENASFPTVYSGWPLSDRVNYWVSALYRLRHRTGELGALEDDVFGPGLISKMKSIDTDINSILPAILKGLAAMESISPQGLLLSFNLRTGLSIVP
ncbi:hypothetical protein [Leeia aquatica]|uniref:Uncharacterized protein n=1 Tax=Leeia aquatica TaxID=2725557 RepID=A0A847RTH0_9NEIS|nr:hypothetical protein [Leeia aquatica]NLR74500.1 hypothetical protein [Leeia aquatica]